MGFIDANYESFCTPDSIYKLHRGGKGLGRLICLQAFDHVVVSSDFKNGNGWERRNIRLQSEEPEIAAAIGDSLEQKRSTEVRLMHLRSEYESRASMTLSNAQIG